MCSAACPQKDGSCCGWFSSASSLGQSVLLVQRGDGLLKMWRVTSAGMPDRGRAVEGAGGSHWCVPTSSTLHRAQGAQGARPAGAVPGGTGRKMLGAQCVCEEKGLGVQKYRSALQGNPFTFSCKEAVELQGCRYRCPSFPPREMNLSGP